VRIPRFLPRSGYDRCRSSTRFYLVVHIEDITLVLYMDDRHRFVGHAIVATGWVEASRLSAHPITIGAKASRATGCVIIRYRCYGLPSATEAEQRSFCSIAGACWHHGLTVVDHLVVSGASTGLGSAFLGEP
jgi:DNA repair protein RadC